MTSFSREATWLFDVAAFSAVEVAVLTTWLVLAWNEPLASVWTLVGVCVLALGMLVVSFLEHVTVNGVHNAVPATRLTIFSITRTVLWIGWVELAARIGGSVGIAVAGAVLAFLLIPQHTIEDNVLRGEPFFSSLADRKMTHFSLIEATGATAWLAIATGAVSVTDHVTGAAAALGLHVGSQFWIPGFGGVSLPWIAAVCVLAAALFIKHAICIRFSLRRTLGLARRRWSTPSLRFERN